VILAAAALAAAATPGSAGAAVDPGDILVADLHADAVVEVDPSTGGQTVISDNTINTGTDLFVDPSGIALDDSGNILVADAETGAGNTGAVISVNPTTGQQTVVSDNTINTGTDHFENPIAIALEADGDILIADNPVGIADPVIRVDPATGQQTLVSSNDVNTGADLFSQLSGIAVESDGQILLSDLDSLSPHPGAIIRVDPTTGQQSVVSSNVVNSGTDLFSEPWGVTLGPSGQIVATDSDAPDNNGAVIAIDGAGQQTAISNNAINTGTDLFNEPRRSRFDAAGNIIVVDSNRVLSVNPMTGQHVAVSQGLPLINAYDLTIVPGGFVPPPPPPPPPPGGGAGGGTVTPTPTATPPAPPKCRKGQKLRKGKCVKKKRKRKK
jgi:sugar lactone lactonase YvrE